MPDQEITLPGRRTVTIDDVTESNLKQWETESAGITDYPILDFNEESLERLRMGIEATLQHSELVPAGGPVYRFCKRAFDIVASALGLAVLAIPFGIIALLIYKEDKGNPIFKQVRLTTRGKPFVMYKFRSMCVDAEQRFSEVQSRNEGDGIAFKVDHDPRITKIGDFLRRTSIDELPQLLNVLKGDMSVIGPRPPLPREVVLYTPAQMDRLLVKGGLSCICQTEGRSDMEFAKWIESDIRYIKTRSAGLDLKLIFKTVIAVLKHDGAK